MIYCTVFCRLKINKMWLLKIICCVLIRSTIVKSDGFEDTLGPIHTKTAPDQQKLAVERLLVRIVQHKSNDFRIEIDPVISINNKDTFQLKKLENGTIWIRGSTGIAAALGFNHYLKYYCNCQIDWQLSQLDLPKIWPWIDIKIVLNDRFRYYQNTCTTSYSFVWWSWSDWVRHIDWMALNGINLPLAFTGHEAIWAKIYRNHYNLTQFEIDEYFTGPAFLSWSRMGNLRTWGGPLTSKWHKRSLKLQKKILRRMRDFGMVPVLSGFAGFVPKAFKRLYPNVKMVQTASWSHFNNTFSTYFLDPTEDLFQELGRIFMQEQTREFGTNHIYSCDSFNENRPANGDSEYLQNSSKAIFKTMLAIDPKAIWLMQNWLFVFDPLFWTYKRVEALLTAVPKGRLLVLDLQSEQWPQYERFQQYFGQPYIWCMLHNFGGTLGMFGSTKTISTVPHLARNHTESTMVGIGLTPEGINQNYVIYDLMLENSWRPVPINNLTEWYSNYTIRRYGIKNTNLIHAWDILRCTVYNFEGKEKIRGKYAISRSPTFTYEPWRWYRFKDVISSWFLFQNTTLDTPTFLYDVVDLTRQNLQIFGDEFFIKLKSNFQRHQVQEFLQNSKDFLGIFNDLEEILASNQYFLLGRWLESAKSIATLQKDRENYEFNAKNQITLWGPNGEILDYATKQWSGIVSHFYQPRWMYFLKYAQHYLNQPGSSFNQTWIKGMMLQDVEIPFTYDHSTNFPAIPKGDPLTIARKIYQKYSRNLDGLHLGSRPKS